MFIGGLQKFTLIDYPGKIAATVFTVGCNFACPFCHNPELVQPAKMEEKFVISEEDFFDFLSDRVGMLDGVCITGGEPTIQKDLPEFISAIKDLGFLVKLDTNGSNPQVLEKLISSGKVDYVAMDIKCPLEKYSLLSNSKIDIDNIERSARLIMDMDDYEFRTTVLPRFHDKEDILDISRWLKGSKRYFLQQFRNEKTLDPAFGEEESYSSEKLASFCRMASPYFDHCAVRE